MPKDTASIALVYDDPEASRWTWVHWVVFYLPQGLMKWESGIPTLETLPSGARQGQNDFGEMGYGGPAPPAGKVHRYFFKLHALDAMLDHCAGATTGQLEKAMKGPLPAEGQLMGTYRRSRSSQDFVTLRPA